MHTVKMIGLTFFCTLIVISLIVYFRRIFPKPIERGLEGLRDWWLPIAKKIGHVQSIVLLSILYYTGIALTAICGNLMRKDFLRLRVPARWNERPHRKQKKDTIETLSRQF